MTGHAFIMNVPALKKASWAAANDGKQKRAVP